MIIIKIMIIITYVLSQSLSYTHTQWLGKRMQQVSSERVSNKTWLGGEGDPLGIVQDILVWTCEQMVYAQAESVLENETHKLH